ncbi:Uncharacterised protein [Mycobacterium tuberculosis]|nr:Uncharacterised protein [Mycobacterium tuberculosis]
MRSSITKMTPIVISVIKSMLLCAAIRVSVLSAVLPAT